MKLVKQAFEKDASGYTTIIPQDKEDLWQIYNLIQKNDEVKLSTHRNVKKGAGNKVERVVMTLRLLVEDIEYTPSDEVMRIRGKSMEPNEHVPLLSYHTAEVQLNKPFTLYKPEWDEISYGIVSKACSFEDKAEVGAVVLEEGVAHLCLVADNMTVLRNKIEKLIPRKRRGEDGGGSHDKALDKFYDMVVKTILRNFDLDRLKAVVLASPGFTAQLLLERLMATAVREENKTVLQNKAKFVVAHSLTGYLQGLEEVLRDAKVQSKLLDTKFAREAMVFEEFQRVLNADDGRAWYGPQECAKAVDLGAVKFLLLTDTLFRSDDIRTRKRYIQMAEDVKSTGGEALIFSSLHELGKQLDMLTGEAVLLNYPVDLEEDEEAEK